MSRENDRLCRNARLSSCLLGLLGDRFFFDHFNRCRAKAFDDFAVYNNTGHFLSTWRFKHHLKHEFLENRTQRTRAGSASDSFFGHGFEAVLLNLEIDTVHRHELAVLLDHRVLWLGENFDELFASQVAK